MDIGKHEPSKLRQKRSAYHPPVMQHEFYVTRKTPHGKFVKHVTKQLFDEYLPLRKNKRPMEDLLRIVTRYEGNISTRSSKMCSAEINQKKFYPDKIVKVLALGAAIPRAMKLAYDIEEETNGGVFINNIDSGSLRVVDDLIDMNSMDLTEDWKFRSTIEIEIRRRKYDIEENFSISSQQKHRMSPNIIELKD